jgi:hypothetical protein
VGERDVEHVRVRFGANETGWARREGGKLFVSNIPMADGLCLDDEVELDGRRLPPEIVRVVARRWPLKSVVTYTPETRAAWLIVCTTIRESGLGWTEGWVSGTAGCCHTAELTQERLDALLAERGAVDVTATLEHTHEPTMRGVEEV